MRLTPAALLTVLAACAALTGCGSDDGPAATASTAMPVLSGKVERSTTAQLRSPDGAALGTVSLAFDGTATSITVEATGLTPGAHGFHLHTTGLCEPGSPDPADPAKTGDFLSAGGHLAEQGQSHGSHTGDLPSLVAGPDGAASLTTRLTGVAEDAVLDTDGTAVVVHALPDNFGNVPDRYAPGGVDDTTRKTGDAGGRIACAAVTRG